MKKRFMLSGLPLFIAAVVLTFGPNTRVHAEQSEVVSIQSTAIEMQIEESQDARECFTGFVEGKNFCPAETTRVEPLTIRLPCENQPAGVRSGYILMCKVWGCYTSC